MKYLVVGLGNPGTEYDGTRHNVGFMVLDALVDASSTTFSTDRYGDVAQVTHRGRTLVLLKPSTYMNLSGKAVRYWMQQERIPIERILVIVDDLALPLGTVRLRAKGSNGGHNGLKDIESTLESAAYARLRVGIGHAFSRGQQIDYVLQRFGAEELETLRPAIQEAVRGVQLFATIGVERAMNDLNTQHNATPERDGNAC